MQRYHVKELSVLAVYFEVDSTKKNKKQFHSYSYLHVSNDENLEEMRHNGVKLFYISGHPIHSKTPIVHDSLTGENYIYFVSSFIRQFFTFCFYYSRTNFSRDLYWNKSSIILFLK